MIEKKDIKMHELKYYYDSRHGFVFRSKDRGSYENMESMCNLLKNIGFTDSMPEFYSEFGDTTVFVYPQICEFKSGPLHQATNQICGQLPFLLGETPFEIDIFNAWLTNQN